LLRLGVVGPLGRTSIDDLLPVLISAGLLCVLGLTQRNHSTSFWLAAIAAAAIVTIDLATYARTARPLVTGDGWRSMAIVVCLAALLGVGAAAVYAATRDRLPRGWTAAAGVGAMLVVGGAAVWAMADIPVKPLPAEQTDGSPLGGLGIVTRAFLVAVVGLTALGLAGDARPAADRARQRVAFTRGPARSTGDQVATGLAWLRAFVEELRPGRSRVRQAALAERSRIARDLHADVMPGLRRALADAERDVPPDRLAASLREVLAEVEAWGATQHAIQLEVGGLVAALEWLAEREEERSDVTVTLDVEDSSSDSRGTTPPDVTAAAFRVATLALDNVVRHVSNGQASVTIRADADVVDLAVSDDGPGLAPGVVASAQADGRRGLADMAAEGAACGALLEVGQGPGGVGTRVRFVWRRGTSPNN
jgi:signal transduction histidine kinase